MQTPIGRRALKIFLRVTALFKKPSLARLFNATPLVIAVSAGITRLILSVQDRVQPQSDRSPIIAHFAYLGIGLALGLFGIIHVAWRKKHPLAGIEGTQQLLAKVFVLSVQIGILLLPVSAFFAVWHSPYADLQWRDYGFLDKRFVLSLYSTLIITFLILPPVLWKLLTFELPSAYETPVRETLSSQSDSAITHRTRRRLERFFKVMMALGIAYFMFGPPWNIQRTPLFIDFHEQVNLGPLQAIDKGYLPNIGPAGQQYGPGYQLAMYTIMKGLGQFNILGFRESQALLYFFVYCLFAVAAFQILSIPWALLAIFLSVNISPFSSIRWNGTDAMIVWGWPNPLRYVGGFLLLAMLPRLTTVRRRPLTVILVGVLWGFFCWMSPENLLMGIAGSGLFFVLVWATDTVSLRKAVRDVALIAVGAVLCWSPVALFYLSQGRLKEYLANVFRVGGLVLNGFSDTLPRFDIMQSPQLANLSYFLVPLLVLCGIAVLFASTALQRPLDGRRLMILALTCISLTNLFGALSRSDAEHLRNTLISVPILLALLIQDFPRLVGANGARAWFVRAVLIMIVFMFAQNYGPDGYAQLYGQFVSRAGRFTVSSPLPDSNIHPSTELIAYRRTGYSTIPLNSDIDFNPGKSFTLLFEPLEEMHRIIGNHTVFVQSFPYERPGLVYFLADLKPPPILVDPTLMVFNNVEAAQFDQHFETIAANVDFIIATTPDVSKAFYDAHPKATVLKRTLLDKDYFIIGVLDSAGSR